MSTFGYVNSFGVSFRQADLTRLLLISHSQAFQAYYEAGPLFGTSPSAMYVIRDMLQY